MEIILSKEALKDLKYWKKTNNIVIQKRITLLLNNVLNHPFTGIGNHEPLKHHLAGFWSRRIHKEHRLVYRVDQEKVTVISMRFHYDK